MEREERWGPYEHRSGGYGFERQPPSVNKSEIGQPGVLTLVWCVSLRPGASRVGDVISGWDYCNEGLRRRVKRRRGLAGVKHLPKRVQKTEKREAWNRPEQDGEEQLRRDRRTRWCRRAENSGTLSHDLPSGGIKVIVLIFGPGKSDTPANSHQPHQNRHRERLLARLIPKAPHDSRTSTHSSFSRIAREP